jgi:phosphoesterase RecJ-like protein
MELFYETPIINIDHLPSNENFGQINLVETPATSSCEVIYDVVSTLFPNQLNEDIATMLLCGIIEKTDCFKRTSVTPKSLSIASKLIDAGARREEIITNLYQTKTISMLRLWGRSLARLKNEGGVYWSLLNGDDFAKAQASAKELPLVMADLVSYIPNADVVILIAETKKDTVNVFAQSKVSGKDLLDVFMEFGALGSKNNVEFILAGLGVLEAEKEVIGKVLSWWNIVNTARKYFEER